ncbi:MAG: tRNA pseudouridine(55) synthase TruB, partial [Pseudomonadota bacterium]
ARPPPRAARLLPADSLLGELPRLDLDEAQAERFLLGQAIPSRGPQEGSACRVYGAGTLLGVGRLENGVLQPRRSIARG